MFAHTNAAERNADPIFRALGSAAGRYPSWNFHKYLIGRDGQLIADYQLVTPQDLIPAIQDALANYARFHPDTAVSGAGVLPEGDCALNQTHTDCEVVAVIDDDSHYELPNNVIQVRTGRRGSGPNAARNAGLVWCSGHMIVPLDADDWMHPTRVEKLIPLVKSFGVAGCSEITQLGYRRD